MGLRLVELTDFVHEEGACWISALPDWCPHGGSTEDPDPSVLRLFEDGNELGPRAAPHDLVRSVGRGAYSHWGSAVWFSTSDNSSPAANGRRYVAMIRDAVDAAADRLEQSSVGDAPVNLQLRRASDDTIDADAQYAITVARSYVEALPRGRLGLSESTVLELGPGRHFGTPLVLLCWGARAVGVADRYLATFQPHYHVPLYARIRQLLEEDADCRTLAPIDECLRSGSHRADGLELHPVPLEDLAASVRSPYDITASNAVFEHLFDPLSAARSLYAVTAPGGVGLHQVDFRDHRNFSAPLEFLLLDELSFAREFQSRHGETGNRVRPHQLAEMLRTAGFDDVTFECGMRVEPEYLREFEPRLRRAVMSNFRWMPIELLEPLGGRFRLRRSVIETSERANRG